MQLYRDRKAVLLKRVADGTLSPSQLLPQLKAFAEDLFRRRGDPRIVYIRTAEDLIVDATTGDPPTT
jgi:hypothetical protein